MPESGIIYKFYVYTMNFSEDIKYNIKSTQNRGNIIQN